jgi:hypothetical protein
MDSRNRPPDDISLQVIIGAAWDETADVRSSGAGQPIVSEAWMIPRNLDPNQVKTGKIYKSDTSKLMIVFVDSFYRW